MMFFGGPEARGVERDAVAAGSTKFAAVSRRSRLISSAKDCICQQRLFPLIS